MPGSSASSTAPYRTPPTQPAGRAHAGRPETWQCCGSSIGIAQGAGCGKFLAQWMIHADAEINMASVDPRRFGSYADQVYTRAKSFDDYHNMFETPCRAVKSRLDGPVASRRSSTS